MFLVMGIFATSINFAFGSSDFILEMKNVNETPEVSNFKIVGESYKQICPSAECKIIKYTFTNFIPPTPTSMSIAYHIEFRLQDDITNKDLGPKKKEFLEQYTASMYGCTVNDIKEDNGQEIYYCSDGTNSINRNFDSKSWYYNSNGIYDAKKDTYTVTGNFTGNSLF
jgi:hypothetical protein